MSGTFLVECYTPGSDERSAELESRSARAVADALRHEGHAIEYVKAILVPGDEVVFHVFTADDIEVVRAAGVRAGLPVERVVESFEIGLREVEAW